MFLVMPYYWVGRFRTSLLLVLAWIPLKSSRWVPNNQRAFPRTCHRSPSCIKSSGWSYHIPEKPKLFEERRVIYIYLNNPLILYSCISVYTSILCDFEAWARVNNDPLLAHLLWLHSWWWIHAAAESWRLVSTDAAAVALTVIFTTYVTAYIVE
jgi:hypothetical protein